MKGITLPDCVKIIEDSLTLVATKSKEKLGLNLVKADVVLAVEKTYEVDGKVKFDLVLSIEAGGKVESSNAQILSLTLRPKGGVLKLGPSSQANELADAIITLATGIKEVGLTRFRVDEGTIEVRFVIVSEGKLKVVAGLASKAENTHSIRLTFEPDV